MLDLLVIGGGINGLGIAADAADRGLSVLLVEKHDFGGGTTAASSRLIHGGLRYLQYGELSLVRESLRERGLLVRQRPHLVRPIELLIPIFRGAKPPGWVVGAGLGLYDLLARDPLFPHPRRVGRAGALRREPGLTPEDLSSGYMYPDAQVEFPERLCQELYRETVEAGGHARNHMRLASLRPRPAGGAVALLRDELTGGEDEVEARVVINAAGPWVDAVNALLPAPPPRLIGGTWGTHLVLPRREGGPHGHIYASARRDGRPFFLLPWDNRLLVGTTDVPFEGDLDMLRVQDWEVEYLLAETNRLFPACAYTTADVEYTTIGVRPLPASDQKAGAITRRHFLVDHGREHGLRGVGSVVGGKLTTYRSLAEETVDWVAAQLPGERRIPASSTGKPATGATLADLHRQARQSLRSFGLGSVEEDRLVRLYGPRFPEVIEELHGDPTLGRPLAAGCTALAAEVTHAIRREAARTTADLLYRRLMLLPPPPGAAEAAATIAAASGLRLEKA